MVTLCHVHGAPLPSPGGVQGGVTSGNCCVDAAGPPAPDTVPECSLPTCTQVLPGHSGADSTRDLSSPTPSIAVLAYSGLAVFS